MVRNTRKATIAVLSAVTVAAGTVPATGTAFAQESGNPPPALDQPYAWGENFESPDALDGWNIFRRTDYTNPDALYTDRALSIEDGQLTIITQRHCVDEDIDLNDPTNHHLLTGENAQVAPCAPDQFQKFTSGRLVTPEIARGAFDLEVRASFHTGGTEGVRSAIWMQNGESACSTAEPGHYGELDLVEHFSHDARDPWSPSNTHLGCNPQGQNATNDAPRELRLDEGFAATPHTWRVSTSETGVAYFIDGEPIDRHSWRQNDRLGHATVADFGLSRDEYSCIVDRPWSLTLNQKIEEADWAHPTDPADPFPVRTMVVESIQVSGAPFDRDQTVDPCENVPEPATPNPGLSSSSQLLGSR